MEQKIRAKLEVVKKEENSSIWRQL